MPPLLKKHQKPDVVNFETEVLKHPLILKKSESPPTSLPAAEIEITIKEHQERESATKNKSMKRLSATIDSQAFHYLKCYAAFTGGSLVSTLNDLIYKHCSVKISI